MEVKNSIRNPERKGCNAIVTITPRKVVDEDSNQVIIDITNNNISTESSNEVTNDNSDKQESDSQSRSDKLRSIKQELQKKLGQYKPLTKCINSRVIPWKALFKWMIIVLNVVIELTQAVYTQDESSRQISKANCGKLSVIMSSICLVISIVDIIFEAWEGEVKWRKRGICPWFYYPGKKGRPFGSFWVGFGLVSSMVQFWVSLVGYVTHGSGSIRFDYLPLLLAVCFLLAALGGGKRSMWVVVKCDIKHGEYEMEGRFVRGSWCFACPSCETATRSV